MWRCNIFIIFFGKVCHGNISKIKRKLIILFLFCNHYTRQYIVIIFFFCDTGKYLWVESTWRQSSLCTISGFLSLVSNEVSAFMICLITLDRFIVLKFPFSTVRFKGRSALASAVLAWMVGISLAAVPLVPSLSWSFYGHTGICIPLPVTRGHFEGKDYAFAVMIVVNFVVFLCIAHGQV